MGDDAVEDREQPGGTGVDPEPRGTGVDPQRGGARTGPQPGGTEVDPEQVEDWLEGDRPPQVIDVRETYEREAGHIAATRHIELVALSAQAGSLDRERPIVFYCRVGARSEMAAQAFRTAGFEAYSMVGGLVRWAREGRPLSPEGGYVAEH
ncbi:MAG TPA: rhodanese-like domain-containing protein [Solirubrobacteraceae bacterium]|jgi:hydroxyacylglutathione hydrolase/adenylyltransferase/sulfurtransferase